MKGVDMDEPPDWVGAYLAYLFALLITLGAFAYHLMEIVTTLKRMSIVVSLVVPLESLTKPIHTKRRKA